MGKLGKDV